MKQRESFFSIDREEREQQEQAASALVGEEDIDFNSLSDEELALLLQSLTKVEENSSIRELIEVFREMDADDKEIIRAISVHTGMHMDEAKDVLERLG